MIYVFVKIFIKNLKNKNNTIVSLYIVQLILFQFINVYKILYQISTKYNMYVLYVYITITINWYARYINPSKQSYLHLLLRFILQ